jgi:hypothetical protein
MPKFVAIHKWKKEAYVTVARKVIEAIPRLPEGITLCYSWVAGTQDGAWCIYETKTEKGGEQIENFLKKNVPEMDTIAKPILQFYPPAPDIYMLTHSLIAK